MLLENTLFAGGVVARTSSSVSFRGNTVVDATTDITVTGDSAGCIVGTIDGVHTLDEVSCTQGPVCVGSYGVNTSGTPIDCGLMPSFPEEPQAPGAGTLSPVNVDFGANFLELNVPVRVPTGEVVELVGAGRDCLSYENDTITLELNGFFETFVEGDTKLLGDVSIFAENLFITNIPSENASANIMLPDFATDILHYIELDISAETPAGELTLTNYSIGECLEEGEARIIVDVDGVRKSMEDSDLRYLNGLEFFVDDIFLTDIQVLKASANVFIGHSGTDTILSVEKDFDFRFTSEGKTQTVELETFVVGVTELVEDAMFVVSNNGQSVIFEVTDVDSDGITIENLFTGNDEPSFKEGDIISVYVGGETIDLAIITELVAQVGVGLEYFRTNVPIGDLEVYLEDGSSLVLTMAGQYIEEFNIVHEKGTIEIMHDTLLPRQIGPDSRFIENEDLITEVPQNFYFDAGDDFTLDVPLNSEHCFFESADSRFCEFQDVVYSIDSFENCGSGDYSLTVTYEGNTETFVVGDEFNSQYQLENGVYVGRTFSPCSVFHQNIEFRNYPFGFRSGAIAN